MKLFAGMLKVGQLFLCPTLIFVFTIVSTVMAEDEPPSPPAVKYVAAWADPTIHWKVEENDWNDPPRAVMQAVIDRHQLVAGDVVAFDDHRGSMHFLIDYDSTSKKFSWRKSIDPGGYLLIPKANCARFQDAILAHRLVIADRGYVSFELPSTDGWVVGIVGKLPADWEVAMSTVLGEPSLLNIRPTGREWEEYNLPLEFPNDRKTVRRDLGLPE